MNRNMRSNAFKVFAVGSFALVMMVLGLLLFSERFSEAGTNETEQSTPLATRSLDSTVYIDAIERLKNEYSAFNTVELVADVTVQLFKQTGTVSGNGNVVFSADGSKYKYSCTISDNLEAEGLMRNIDVVFDGSKFFFNDRDAQIVSYQSSEEVRLPTALPNPFFLPLEFLSNDDDSCEGCKMRLQDVKQPIRWPKRASTISEVTTESQGTAVNNLIRMEGGKLSGQPYEYRVRLIGEQQTMQPVSVTRVTPDGIPLIEVLLNDQRFVNGSTVRLPHQIEVGARDETGRVVLRAVYTITTLKINQPLPAGALSRVFPGTESYWNSDTKSFTPQP
ncbi:MAG: hypothetical protein ACT4O9_11210 [Blastocatellia bacterium]